MTILKILEFPDERLRIKAKPVLVFDSNLKKLVGDMAETMYAAPGIGLAATQVNIHKRVIVVDVSNEKNNLIGFHKEICKQMHKTTNNYVNNT